MPEPEILAYTSDPSMQWREDAGAGPVRTGDADVGGRA